MTDGRTLVRIIESDHSGAIAEDQLDYRWFEISPLELMQRWTRDLRSKSRRL